MRLIAAQREHRRPAGASMARAVGDRGGDPKLLFALSRQAVTIDHALAGRLRRSGCGRSFVVGKRGDLGLDPLDEQVFVQAGPSRAALADRRRRRACGARP